MKWAVQIHCHKVQNTEVIYITLNHTSCSQALTKKKKKKWTHNIAESELQKVMYSVQDAEQGVYLLF